MKKIARAALALLAGLTLALPAGTEENMEREKLVITVNGTALYAVPEENEAARALTEKLEDAPVTITMNGYGGWEQVGGLGFALPAEDEYLTAQAGDIMLYCGNQMVIFYGSNSWEYTRLGHIEEKTADELEAILGSGEITVTLSLG